LVRLGLWTEAHEVAHHLEFQFHFGSIRAALLVGKMPLQCHSFNSTLVRLGLDSLTPADLENLFQFHFGSIRAELLRSFRQRQSGFNSTLVRLGHTTVERGGGEE